MSNQQNCYVIGVCGKSCSGKTTASHAIQKLANETFNKNKNINEQTNDIVVVSQDWWYKGGNSETNFDIPDTVDFDEMILQLNDLINGKEIYAPIYDFTTHSRKKEKQLIKPAKIIIVEGILIFYKKELRDMFHLKVFVSALPEMCYERRLKRDVDERGRDIKEVKMRYFRDVLPASSHYVDPTLQYSNIVLVNNEDDKFVGLDILLDHIKNKVQSMCGN